MGFFQDLKQDLSQAVNEMVPEDAETEQGDVTARAEATSSEDLFGQTDGEEFADLEAMLDNEAHESFKFLNILFPHLYIF